MAEEGIYGESEALIARGLRPWTDDEIFAVG